MSDPTRFDRAAEEAVQEMFGMVTPGRDAPGVTEAEALGLSWNIDVDDFDMTFDEDVEMGQEEALSADIEDEAETLAIDRELAELLVDEEDAARFLDSEDAARGETDGIFEQFGRRAMACRVREQMDAPGRSAFGCGYGAGYMAALRDLGLDEGVIQESYGGLVNLIGKGIGGIAKLALGAGKGLLGDVKLADVAKQVGVGVRERLSDVAPGAELDEDAPTSTDTVEADASTLPPVYVEDERGFQEDLSDTEDLSGEPEPVFGLRSEDRFGATCLYGFVGGQPRKRAREAAHRAAVRGKKAMSHRRRSDAKPLVEDPAAQPVMYSNGAIYDAVYGRLEACPCPSCARVADRKAAQGKAGECVVCEGYGAILLPASDVEAYAGCTSYGILGALALAAGTAIGKGIAKGKLFPKAGKRAKKWLHERTRPKEERARSRRGMTRPEAVAPLERAEEAEVEAEEEPAVDEVDEAEEALDALEEEIEEEMGRYGAVRALVPTPWWQRHVRSSR